MPSKDPEKRKAAWKAWYEKNKEKKSQYDKKRYGEKGDEIREKNRQRHEVKKEEYNSKSREYHAAHREHINERKRAKRVLAKDPGNWKAIEKVYGLQECPRLHCKAVHLPCGQREECFGAPICPKVPARFRGKKEKKLW